jgi:hypothetical protein
VSKEIHEIAVKQVSIKKKTFRNLFTQVYSRDFGAKSLREENSRPKAKPNNVSSCEQQDNFF